MSLKKTLSEVAGLFILTSTLFFVMTLVVGTIRDLAFSIAGIAFTGLVTLAFSVIIVYLHNILEKLD